MFGTYSTFITGALAGMHTIKCVLVWFVQWWLALQLTSALTLRIANIYSKGPTEEPLARHQVVRAGAVAGRGARSSCDGHSST